MFHLLVKGGGWAKARDSMPLGRVLEYTDDVTAALFSSGKTINTDSVTRIPALFMSETGSDGDQYASVGRITQAKASGREVVIDYTLTSFVPSISNSVLETLSSELGIDSFEFVRTHWAIKDADLFEILYKHHLTSLPSPKVFTISGPETFDESLVSVMMPFKPRFDRVYAMLQKAVRDKQLNCLRADDIWESDAVIQDVVSLINRARIVICDCTGRNPNVFYETGIAHTLGRNVILITQSKVDIPFDLRHLRYVLYKDTAEGLRLLARRVKHRIQQLVE